MRDENSQALRTRPPLLGRFLNSPAIRPIQAGLHLVFRKRRLILGRTRELEMELNIYSPLPYRKDFRIGILGAGFIVKDCHLVAYRKAGFNPVAIASRTRAGAEKVAQKHAIIDRKSTRLNSSHGYISYA